MGSLSNGKGVAKTLKPCTTPTNMGNREGNTDDKNKLVNGSGALPVVRKKTDCVTIIFGQIQHLQIRLNLSCAPMLYLIGCVVFVII